jgi:hypothetical protein
VEAQRHPACGREVQPEQAEPDAPRARWIQALDGSGHASARGNDDAVVCVDGLDQRGRHRLTHALHAHAPVERYAQGPAGSDDQLDRVVRRGDGFAGRPGERHRQEEVEQAGNEHGRHASRTHLKPR